MKRKINILLVLSLLLYSTSCEKYVSKDDRDPNNPTTATLQTLLPVVEVAVFSTNTGQMARTSGIWAQHFTGTQFQFVEYGKYSLSENDVQNDWNTIYTAGIANANEVIAKGTAQGSPYYVGIGKILKCMLLGIASDFWGDIPEREAGLGIENLTPHYDAQQVVIADMQSMLSEAIAALKLDISANNGLIPTTDDFIHNGDASAWIRTAWILKARYANRLSKRDGSGSATAALQYIDNAIADGLSGNADDANAIFEEAGGSALNQWYAFEQDRAGYIKTCATLIDTMNALNDPRLPFYAAPDTGGAFSGTPIDSEDQNTSSIGSYFASPSAPMPLITYVEARFIEAEAALRSGNNARAQTAYTEALTAALNRYDGIDAAGVTAYLAANGTLGSSPLAQIMFQKWISSYTQPEAWSDWRRTNLPALTPNPSGIIPTIPVRYPTEQNERLYNPNAVVVSNLTSNVWWAQ
ncbi:MAG TPA: SusD/RagB family nutrient-binding outer membrane lipoprotein [Bacteroidia bacterium]|nr:SusD/RagB family nutrient-binding outer membrane lipoprotein [Bacteroidia bacterium]